MDELKHGREMINIRIAYKSVGQIEKSLRKYIGLKKVNIFYGSRNNISP